MTDFNGLPPKVYRKLLLNNYIQTKKDSKAIKDKWSRNGNPICQEENRYFSPRTKGNILTQEYIKKMAEKPEKNHIIRVPIKSSLTRGLKVIEKEKKKEGIRLNPKIRKNQSSISAPKFEAHQKHISKNNLYKNFYLDNFNSLKENQNDISLQNQVSIIKNNN